MAEEKKQPKKEAPKKDVKPKAAPKPASVVDAPAFTPGKR